MESGACSNGHKEICKLAKKWSTFNTDNIFSVPLGTICFNSMLMCASSNGNKEMCELSKKWGANNFNNMLWGACSNGHKEIYELAKEWGANYEMN